MLSRLHLRPADTLPELFFNAASHAAFGTDGKTPFEQGISAVVADFFNLKHKVISHAVPYISGLIRIIGRNS